MNVERLHEWWRDRRRANPATVSTEEHLAASLQWLRCAQDASADGGVAHSYLVGRRWLRSYPETTGYILPTLLNAHALGRGEDGDLGRALRMADWELDVQLSEGAIPELTSGAPTVFDTGQVIFGWLAAHRVSEDTRYLEAAERAGRWLIETLDPDGVWRHSSDSGGPGRVYNVRVVWALLLLGERLGRTEFAAGVRRFLDWTLTQEVGDGWFDRNCLTQDESPLLHTIAYTARGQLECGLLTADERLVAASRRTADAVLRRLDASGYVAGRLDREWNACVSWACLTGMAQMALVWRRHAEFESDAALRGRLEDAATRVMMYLKRIHDLDSPHPGLRGGVRGSHPIRGAYGRWQVLNWATKFFADALLLELDEAGLVHPG